MAQDTQRPAIRASGDCPIALTTGSHPSSNSGRDAGGALSCSIGPFTALRLLPGISGKRSPLRVRLTDIAVRSVEGAAVVAETSRPMRKEATANTAPQQPTKNRE